MRIIPAIDIINGKCVRLSKGDYATQIIYNESPVEVAKKFEDSGIEYLHLVDLDGAKSSHIVNHKVLYEIASNTRLKIDFGGGIKTNKDLQIAFENGASQVTAGSIAESNPDLFLEWLRIYGPDMIILGADCKDRKITSMGWLHESSLDVIEFIQYFEKHGIVHVICTDVTKDGMLQGTSEILYTDIITNTDVSLIASGGTSCIEDIRSLKVLGCEAVIIGKAIYEGRISLKDLVTLC